MSMFNFLAKAKEKKKKELEEKEEFEKKLAESRLEEEKRLKLKQEEIKIQREAEKRRIQLEKKENEEKILLELSNELQENFWATDRVFTRICSRYSILINRLRRLDFTIEDDLLFLIFMDIYEETRDVESIIKFQQICDLEKVDFLIEKYFSPISNIEFPTGLSLDLRNYIGDILDIHKDKDVSILSDFIFEDSDWIEYLNDSEKEAYEDGVIYMASYKINLIIQIVGCAVAINRILVLQRNISCLLNCNELYNIQKNLNKQFKDYNIINQKLYPIYEKFYSDVFCEKFSSFDLLLLIKLVNIQQEEVELELYKREKICLPIQDKISTIIENICKDFISIGYKFDVIKDNFKNFVKNCEWENLNTDTDSDVNFICIYGIIMKDISKVISPKLFFITYTRSIEIFNIYDEFKEERRLSKEKERYLNGDFTLENNIEKDRIEMHNIKTGIEFEVYLKNIFEKLGYKVETTKATGDQGADLILIKDNMKTVVQAKYYSGSVGNKAIQEVVSAIKYYDAKNGMVVTNSYFTKAAVDLAKANDVILIDKVGLSDIKESIFKSIGCNYNSNMSDENDTCELDLIEKYEYLNNEIDKYVNALLEDTWEDITLEKLIVIYIKILEEQSLETENLVAFKMVLENTYSIIIDNDEGLEEFISLVHQIYNV